MLEAQIQHSKTSIDAWLFRIYAELHVDARGVNSKAVQLLFERAVRALQQQPSTAIWRLYSDWTLSQDDGLRAKALLSRALQECPWDKGMLHFHSDYSTLIVPFIIDVHLLAFKPPLQLAFTAHELSGDLYSSITSRELRIRVAASPYFARATDDQQAGSFASLLGGDDGRDDDDAFRLVQDRARLMPY